MNIESGFGMPAGDAPSENAPLSRRRALSSPEVRQASLLSTTNGLPLPAIATSRYVLLPLANLITGYTVKAMERKIERGDWREGKEWRHAPDGRVLIDLQGYQRWVEGQ
jgi:hypothetical protein